MYGIGVVLGARLLSPRHTRRPMGRAARARQGVVSRQVGPAAAAAGPLMILDVDPKICPPKDAVSHETRSRTGVQNWSPEPPPPNLTSCMHVGHKPQKGHCLIVVCGVWCAFFLNGPENLMFIYIYKVLIHPIVSKFPGGWLKPSHSPLDVGMVLVAGSALFLFCTKLAVAAW